MYIGSIICWIARARGWCCVDIKKSRLAGHFALADFQPQHEPHRPHLQPTWAGNISQTIHRRIFIVRSRSSRSIESSSHLPKEGCTSSSSEPAALHMRPAVVPCERKRKAIDATIGDLDLCNTTDAGAMVIHCLMDIQSLLLIGTNPNGQTAVYIGNLLYPTPKSAVESVSDALFDCSHAKIPISCGLVWSSASMDIITSLNVRPRGQYNFY